MAGTEGRSYVASWRSNNRAVAVAGLSVALVAALVYPTAAHAARPAANSAANTAASSAQLAGARWGDPKADQVAKDSKGKNAPVADPGSLYTIENAIGARKVWQQTDASRRQLTGQGVTVALLDSGTAAVPGLSAVGKLTYGPDLSIESNGPLTDQDTYGHGTHLAGIIAGRDPATLTSSTIPTLNPAVQLGVAPDAGLLTMKLANTDGSTDVSQVIAALNWVTEHQTAPNGTKIRVINLSFGSESLQGYQLDPLAAAAENAWRHGVVVVVSGGNDGSAAARLTDPAIDPYVLAVGASDGADSVTGWAKPTTAPFSSRGTAQRHVDVLAPGTSIVSLRDPGSYVDVNHPEGLVAGDTTGRLFRGSGTSQAAAVVSGAVALLLQAYPTVTPDQVKAALTATATRVAGSVLDAGAGQIDVAAALAAIKATVTSGSAAARAARVAVQSFPISTGQGSLDAARGGDAIIDPSGAPVTGEVDVQGDAWNPAAWWAGASTLTSWSGGTWMGATWTGDGWLSTLGGLLSSRWSSSRWSSSRWSSAVWDSSRWSSSSWRAVDWSALLWSATAWA